MLVFVDIMFVFDLANNLLDQILNCCQPINTAIFINDQSHVTPFGLHFSQQNANRHGWWNKQQGPQHLCKIKCFTTTIEAVGQGKVFKVGESNRGIKCTVIDRQPR